MSQKSQENTCARVSFLNFIKKETLTQVFSCEFCEIFENNFFIEHLRKLPLDFPSIFNKLNIFFPYFPGKFKDDIFL